MTLDEYNAFCASLPATTHVVQWGASHVWKVGGKVFAIASQWDTGPDGPPFVTFKTSEMSFDLLKDQPGCRPAPYLASRGMKWIQRISDATMDDAALRDYLAESHRLVAAGLSRKARAELGLSV
jgi:predicted DNA-binding protein (MmcQ/YjbR family)